jgi:hypothetical protein
MEKNINKQTYPHKTMNNANIKTRDLYLLGIVVG